jgi:hypothetical protein
LERRPIGARNTKAAAKIADVIASFRVPAEIEAADAAGEAARANLAAKMTAVSFEEFQTIGVQLGVSYGDSPIVVPDGTAAPEDLPTRYTASARPGARLPHFYFPDGASIYDRLGRGFTLLNLSGVATADAVVAARGRGIPLCVLPILESNIAAFLGAHFVLVRPDQHIAWRGDVLPRNFGRILAQAVGAASDRGGTVMDGAALPVRGIR